VVNITGTTDSLLLKGFFFPMQHSIMLKFIWINLFIPFAIKIPIVPFHSWLPEAHVEAPTEGSVLLAGILLKVGAYGIIRFLFDLLPMASLYFSPFVLLLVSISILYSTFILFRQIDLKKIVAYFSIIHMNFALLGLFTFSHSGFAGSILIFFVHGLVSSGLFICIGFLYQRFHTRNYLSYGGLFTIMPVFSFMSFLLFLANFAFPGTAPFIGELLILLVLFQKNFLLGFIALISVFSSAIFSLLIFTKIFFGIFRFSFYYKMYNYYLYFFEYFILFYLSFFIVFFGITPSFLTDLCVGILI
jgi:NADH-quinone oxidoreductase subunit M